MSAGPMPPPPWKWQPEQFIALKSALPSDTAQALSSYGASIFGSTTAGPGCSWLTTSALAVGAAVGGFSEKRRFSRSHAVSSRATAVVIVTTDHRSKRED